MPMLGTGCRCRAGCRRAQSWGTTRVRAVVYDHCGPPDVLRIERLPMPSPAAGQVLVRIAATSVNLSDWETLRGTPLYSRIGGLRAPARRTLGSGPSCMGTVAA